MLLVFSLISLFSGILYSNSLEFIESKPRGIARDFYIYEYLQGDISQDEAIKLYPLIENKSPKMINALLAKIPKEKLQKDLYCKNLSYKELLNSDDECFNLGFKLVYAINEKIDKKTLSRINSKKILNQVKILESKNILDSIIAASGEDFSDIYFTLGSARANVFNNTPKKSQLLSNKNYNKALYHLIISNQYPKFTQALLKVTIKDVNDWSFFALGLNELNAKNTKKALDYFLKASNSKNLFLRDKSLFWVYKLSDNKDVLNQLADSHNFNLYSLYASRLLKKAPNLEIITIDDPIFRGLIKDKSPFDISNPFEWQILSQNIALVKDKENLLHVAKLFYYENTLPHFIFILNRYFNYSKKFFVMPYSDEIDVDANTKALLYAIAKQESKFLPSVVSRSYALGIMQIMPFNVSYFAKNIGIEATKEDMFNPKIALKFGAYYLEHLNKEFKHPLFVSYAYNGGPTFIRNHLKDIKVFSKSNKYDPWLSMEFIPYEESRIYGIKVMANYIMYNEIAGNYIDIDEFLDSTLR